MPTLARLAPLSLLLVACTLPSGPEVEGGDDGGTGTEVETEDGRCPGETTIAFDTPVQGSTADPGWNAQIADWFDNSDVACTPWGGDYPPPYQVYSLEVPPHSDWYAVVTPAEGVDVAVVSWIRGVSFPGCNPLDGSSVVSCEVSNFESAGGEELVWIRAVTNPYHAVILVSTPPDGTPGAFELRVVSSADR